MNDVHTASTNLTRKKSASFKYTALTTKGKGKLSSSDGNRTSDSHCSPNRGERRPVAAKAMKYYSTPSSVSPRAIMQQQQQLVYSFSPSRNKKQQPTSLQLRQSMCGCAFMHCTALSEHGSCLIPTVITRVESSTSQDTWATGEQSARSSRSSKLDPTSGRYSFH